MRQIARIIVWRQEDNTLLAVLQLKHRSGGKYGSPGGYVSRSDPTIKDGACREFYEETPGLNVLQMGLTQWKEHRYGRVTIFSANDSNGRLSSALMGVSSRRNSASKCRSWNYRVHQNETTGYAWIKLNDLDYINFRKFEKANIIKVMKEITISSGVSRRLGGSSSGVSRLLQLDRKVIDLTGDKEES
mmetsp:Transcript_719/g.904  ORF Transcript_719/g.904 Transcript_719/m.904 type:complete len:188 (+) Transcript_719:38-601(+)|eukprot:CAMPEP_0197318520 /NCGR_PEP_ID=MMETSP0891-20130614/51402_1 /TAXON_ID=44058 ORGANISM="Aureoumbra lagunensis, Strain CCMP1510" /NCGR_SAMPLE_ID=MMETSP0891 /ASSEMBLY_ACC=CAM_ASM_000534 /LENGTH=187 /DNA_ID=CAMNT_0042809025 /DNA_START=20 /DNA_END=583 /DNA_ORIENTATION=+